LADPSASVTAPTSASSTSPTDTAKLSLEVEPSVDVAVTTSVSDGSVSASKLAPAATRTVPSGSTVKRASSTL
jgi:hypothetical protein